MCKAETPWRYYCSNRLRTNNSCSTSSKDKIYTQFLTKAFSNWTSALIKIMQLLVICQMESFQLYKCIQNFTWLFISSNAYCKIMQLTLKTSLLFTILCSFTVFKDPCKFHFFFLTEFVSFFTCLICSSQTWSHHYLTLVIHN